MKRIAGTFAFALIAACGGSAAVWTIENAIARAAESSPDALIARQRVAAAAAMVDQASSGRSPRVTLGAGYMQTDNPVLGFGTILNHGEFSMDFDFNDPGRVDNLGFSGTVGYNLYSGGRTKAGIAAARHGVESAGFDYAAAIEDLAVAVTRAFHSIARTRNGVDALEGAETAARESLRVAILRFEAGELLKSEILNLEVHLGEIRDALLGMRHDEVLARRQLAVLMGLDDGERVEIAPAPDPVAVEVATTAVLENRAELQSMRRRVAAAAQMVHSARAGRRPVVNAFATYQRDQGLRVDGNGDSWIAGVRADWAVFDGRETSGRIHQAEAELAQAREGLRKLELALGFQLEQARLAQELALARRATAENTVAQAAESAAISRARFEAGALLSAELIGVETRLTEARMRRAVARANFAIAAAELKRAAGISLYSTP